MEVETLVAWPILWEHGCALVLVWAWVALAGFAFLPILRLRIGLVGVPLVGVVYWTIALYLFPFAGGLDVAAGLVGLLAAGVCARPFFVAYDSNRVVSRGVNTIGIVFHGAWWKRWATLILAVGCLPYTTTLLFHYVPFGMDASMHTTAATLIARSGGLPVSYAPFAPDLAFPAMNLGLPTVAALAIRWGGEPAAVMLACHHLTFTLLILATYLLLRLWTGRTSAALLAVVTVWCARSSQASLGWGGFPTVLSVAIGVFAARLLLQHVRTNNWRLALATGASIAAIPLIHGVGAGTWLYCVGPWVALTTLLQARAWKPTLRGLALSGAVAAAFLLVYRFAGTIDVQANGMEWTRNWQETSAPLEGNAWLAALGYIRKDAGSFVVMAGWAACGVLALRRQWLAVVLLSAAWLALTAVIVNSHQWFLPASFLLYPERAIYWAAPISAAGLALAWRALPRSRLGVRASIALSLGLLGLAGYYQNQFYQKVVREDFVNQDGWEALVWAREHLHSRTDFVQAAYNSTGSFLPAIAQIGCSGSHHHHFIERQVHEMYRRRTITHVLLDQALAPTADVPAGTVVFRNRTITIVATESRRTGSLPVPVCQGPDGTGKLPVLRGSATSTSIVGE
jgi:hypothetical protein